MRDLIIVGIYAVALCFALRNPFLGVLVFFWISLMNPHRYSWGFAYDLPLAKVAVGVTLVSAIFNFSKLRFPKTREAYLFLLLWSFITVTTIFALYPESAWQRWENVSKVFLMTFIAMLVITERKQLLHFVLAIIVFIGFIGVKGAIFGVMTGGRYKVWGPPDSNLADNNDVGLAMAMIAPLCFILKDVLYKKWQSHGLLAIGVASVIACVLTYSRGAFLGLAVMGIFYFLQAKNKILIVVLAVVVIGASFSFLPSTWFERMNTMKTYGQDTSANQRINSWIFSYRLAGARILGGGFGCFTDEQYSRYAPDPALSSGHTSHSIYFEMMAEHGWIGLIVFLSCLFSMLLSMRKLDHISHVFPNAGWIASYNSAFRVSLIVFMVSAAFLSEAFSDLFWAIYAGYVGFKSIVMSGNWIETPLSDYPSRPEAMEYRTGLSAW